MTKYAIISDIHANYDALDLVIKDAEKRNIDKIVCLGDLVNKYFQPVEVIDAIKAQADIVIKGNHDYSVVTNENFRWVRGKIGMDRINYLDSLPIKEQLLINNVLIQLYHATPNSLTEMFNPTFQQDTYAGGLETDYKNMFIGDTPQIVFAGHTHMPYMGVEDSGKFKIVSEPGIIVSNTDRAIINVGSVGENDKLIMMPDGTLKTLIEPYITYALVDDSYGPNQIHIEVIHVPYQEALKKIYFTRMEQAERAKTEKGLVPDAPNDNRKIFESLQDMGELPRKR